MAISFEMLTALYRRMEFQEGFRVGSLLLLDQSDCDLVDTLLDDPRDMVFLLIQALSLQVTRSSYV